MEKEKKMENKEHKTKKTTGKINIFDKERKKEMEKKERLDQMKYIYKEQKDRKKIKKERTSIREEV